MKGFDITVSNNLLEKKHVKAMGSAVWEYLWLLDKMTKIDQKSECGKVLGGKPIKLQEISDDLGKHVSTISQNLAKMEKIGYIKMIHAPHGIIIIVTKAKKHFTKRHMENTKPHMENAKPLMENPKPHMENTKPNNKTYTIDNTVDNTSIAKKPKTVEEEISKLFYEAIRANNLPVSNHTVVKAKIRILATEDTPERIINYLTFMRDHYKTLVIDYKPHINNGLDLYNKRIQVENILKQLKSIKGKTVKI